MEATDNDEGENAEITYSIYHVSNNGLHKFKIDPKTGVIESVRKLNAGEQYSITVQATDKGGRYSQTIVEVNVIPGPNTRSPVFQQPVYEVQVSEGASINSTVATITVSIADNVSFYFSSSLPVILNSNYCDRNNIFARHTFCYSSIMLKSFRFYISLSFTSIYLYKFTFLFLNNVRDCLRNFSNLLLFIKYCI